MTHVAKKISIAIIIALVIAIALSVFSLPQKVYADPIPAVGDTYGGGIVAYILQSSDPGYEDGKVKGIIASTVDCTSALPWALENYQSTLVNNTKSALGTGSDNTDLIIAQNGAGTGYSAGLARAFNSGGYNDWHLPSLDELRKLFENGILISSQETFYWSSSESGSTEAYAVAWKQAYYFPKLKSNNYYCRPVRYFSITPEEGSTNNEVAEEPVEVWERNHEMTCYQVWINEDNNFEFVFWWEYANNNWVKIYDMAGNEVFSINMLYGAANFITGLPDGMYTAKTFHNGFETPIQEFLIGKP